MVDRRTIAALSIVAALSGCSVFLEDGGPSGEIQLDSVAGNSGNPEPANQSWEHTTAVGATLMLVAIATADAK